MNILKFKIPLVVQFNKPIKKGQYTTYSVNMDEINFNLITPYDIENLDGQYDWIDAWRNRDYDKKMSGFNNKDVAMEVTYEKGNYIITLVSEIPFSTTVKCNRYYTSSIDDFKEMTLKEAIMNFIEGCVWDGIGENEIGQITYQGEKCDVWMKHEIIEI